MFYDAYTKRDTAFLLLVFLSACRFKARVALIIHHATIYTIDSAFSVAEAMAVNDGKIIAVGKNEEILHTYEADSVMDASGKTIFPGFIDAHRHFTGFATDRRKCELVGYCFI